MFFNVYLHFFNTLKFYFFFKVDQHDLELPSVQHYNQSRHSIITKTS